MADATQLILPLRGALIPVPGVPQEGVCSICHSSASPGYPACYPCHEAAWTNPPEILPITLSLHGGLIHDHLRGYKDSRSASVRDRMSLRLAGLLAIFMVNHADCIGFWDYATCVPSAHRTALDRVVTRIRLFTDRYRHVLAARPGRTERALGPAQFTVTGDVSGHRILLLDDTFTSGTKLFGAAAALRQRGAAIIGPVVIGRHIQRSWLPSNDLLHWVEERPWDEAHCAWCAGERRTGTLF